MEILHIQNLSFSYPKAEKRALSDVSMSINEGEFAVICGASGSGKTTLLKLIKKNFRLLAKKAVKYILTELPLKALTLAKALQKLVLSCKIPTVKS